jgi:hypothetical protein
MKGSTQLEYIILRVAPPGFMILSILSLLFYIASLDERIKMAFTIQGNTKESSDD